MTANLHYLFHNAYYEKLGEAEYQNTTPNVDQYFKLQNEAIENAELTPSALPADLKAACAAGMEPSLATFRLKTTYPGLLSGIGSPHQSFAGNEEIKLGFSLDYVTGVPYIPATGVKGVLRNAFRHAEPYVEDKLQELIGEPYAARVGAPFVCKLETAIFGEWCCDSAKTTDPAKRDVFFDAVVTASGNGKVTPSGNSKVLSKVLAMENITPHVNKKDRNLDGLTAPVPLKLLKVRPDVVFTFSFLLRDSNIEDVLVTAAQKRKLFCAILKDLGVGAKTNTGYGYLEDAGESQKSAATEAPPAKPSHKTAMEIAMEKAKQRQIQSSPREDKDISKSQTKKKHHKKR